MRKLLIVLILVKMSFLSLGQFSMDLTLGAGEMRHDIPYGYLSSKFKPSLELSLNYKFDSLPIEINFSPYLLSNSDTPKQP